MSRPARDVLRAITQVVLGIGNRQVNYRALDKAYSQAYTGKKIKIDHKRHPTDPSPSPSTREGSIYKCETKMNADDADRTDFRRLNNVR